MHAKHLWAQEYDILVALLYRLQRDKSTRGQTLNVFRANVTTISALNREFVPEYFCPRWGLAVVGKKYSAHQTKVEKYSVDRLSLAGVWL